MTSSGLPGRSRGELHLLAGGVVVEPAAAIANEVADDGSYKNKFEHDLLDRHLGAILLRFVLRGEPPTLDANRIARSTDLLFEDLERQGIDGLTLERDKRLSLPGLGEVIAPILAANSRGGRFAIGLHGPLTPDEPTSAALRDIMEYSAALPVILVDELCVRRNLPSTTSDLIKQLG